MLDPEALITFAAVARHGSLSGAAQERHRSQPAVSSQMKRLVTEVGEPLYRRTRHGVDLTPAGEELLPYAQALVRALEGARGWARSLEAGTTGRLRIAASMTIAVYLLPGLLSRFHEAHPGLELSLLTRNSVDALALLRRAEADLALVEGPLPDLGAGLHSHPLLHDEIVLAVRPEHRLAGSESLGRDALQGLEIVQRETGSGTREVVEGALAELDVPTPGVRVVLEATGIEAVKEAVLQGFGAGFISRLAIAREVEMGLLVPLRVDGGGFDRSLTLLHPPASMCPRAVRRFLDFLLEQVSSARR